MVPIAHKVPSSRTAVAACTLHFSTPAALPLVRTNALRKGDVLAAARIAGIMAAKKTSELIPLCHPIGLNTIEVEIEASGGTITILATAETDDRTGVEMEAMTAASVAALTLYDMAKGIDRAMRISTVELLEKSGGKSGTFKRDG